MLSTTEYGQHWSVIGGYVQKSNDSQIKVRLPLDLKSWIDKQAQANRGSKSSEIVRSVRERKERKEQQLKGKPT